MQDFLSRITVITAGRWRHSFETGSYRSRLPRRSNRRGSSLSPRASKASIRPSPRQPKDKDSGAYITVWVFPVACAQDSSIAGRCDRSLRS